MSQPSSRHRPVRGLPILLAVLSAFATEAMAGPPPESAARESVDRAEFIVVATLIDPQELTVNGQNHGQGLLVVDRTLFPRGFSPNSLLLRWDHPLSAPCDLGDPRRFEEQPAIWMLNANADGTVRTGAVPVKWTKDDELASFVDELWPLSGDERFDEKVLGLESFLRERPTVLPPPSKTDRLMLSIGLSKVLVALHEYTHRAHHKALAVALDENGRWVYGYGYGLETKEGAIQRALLECAERLSRYRVDAPCRLVMLGDETYGGP